MALLRFIAWCCRVSCARRALISGIGKPTGSVGTGLNETALAGWLARERGARLVALSRLSGGAIQQNWALDVTVEGETRQWVLRTDSASSVSVSLGRAEEYKLLVAAHQAGVTVPRPLALCTDSDVLGRPFFLMERVRGVTAPHRLVRETARGGGREARVEALGATLARLHAITPPRADLAFLAAPQTPVSFVASMRAAIDRLGTPRPVLEWGLRHLELWPVACGPAVLCHNDFRTGNLMFDEASLSAVLDWEFAGWGDPHQDIGWLLARCWRFGAVEHEVGGLGPAAPFYDAYERESGRVIDPERVRFWKLAAAIRWAVIAAEQAGRHIHGGERDLELALTGHIIPELELDILAGLEGDDA